MNENESERDDKIPKALRVWNNAARLSLSKGLYVWLTFLVVTCLSSAFSAKNHSPARFVLGGFILSHLAVIALSYLKNFAMRVGVVSITHVVCWAPELIFTVADFDGRAVNTPYGIWSYALIIAVSTSFIFDLRDAGTYLYYFSKGKLES